MSVQTQIDRISTEVSAQETLLDQALAAIANKAAGGGGGGSVGTCTVTITKPSGWGLHYIDYTELVDGAITPTSQNFSGTSTNISVEAVAGSMLTISHNNDGSELYGSTVCTNCTLKRCLTDNISMVSQAMMIGLPASGTATIAING